MNNTKLIQLLKTFTPHEFHEFGKFIHSPFHNESTMMHLFYDYLKNYFPDFNDTDFTKESVFKKLYGSTEYDDKKIRDRFSDMLNLAENYLAIMNLKQNPFKFKSHILEELTKRRLEVHFNKKVKEIQAVLDTKVMKDIEYFRDNHQFFHARTNFYENRQLLGKRIPMYEDLDQEVEFFLKFFVTQMTTYYLLMKNTEGSLNYEFEYRFYEQVMNFADEKIFDDNLLVKFYSLCLKLIDNDSDETLYFKLKNLFNESSDLLHIMHREIVGAVLFNVALNFFMTGQKKFENEQFEMLKLLIEHEAYPLENGWMSREVYCNGVIVSIINNQPEWAENFIKYNTLRVNPEQREDARLFVTGLLQYSKQKYEEALDSLGKIRGKDGFYYILINALRSRIFFEQNEYESVFALINSFKAFLKSNSAIHKDHKIRYTNYLNALHDLTLLSTSVDIDEYDILKLEEKIKSCSYYEITTNKKWILEKVSQLRERTGKV